MAALDVADWAAGTVVIRGNSVLLSANLQTVIKAAFSEKILMEWDLPTDGSLPPKDVDEVLEVWKPALNDAATGSDPKLPFSATDWAKFKQWMTARLLKDEDGTGPEGTPKFAPPSKEMRADMEAQGLEEVIELMGLELCLHLGRAVAPSECEGGSYCQPPAHMKGAIRMKKSSNLRTLDEVLEEAKKSGDIGPIESHYAVLTHRLSISSTFTKNTIFANRILTFHNKAKNNLRDPMVIINYLQAYRSTYMGRGLPVLYDAELAMMAGSMVRDAPLRGSPVELGLLATGSIKGPASEAGTMSSLSSSVSTRQFSQIESALSLQSEQMKEVLSSMQSMQSDFSSLKRRVVAIERDAGGGGGGDPKDKIGPCWSCGQKGHRKGDPECPNYEEDKKAKEKK
jgi:hypothetical protein